MRRRCGLLFSLDRRRRANGRGGEFGAAGHILPLVAIASQWVVHERARTCGEVVDAAALTVHDPWVAGADGMLSICLAIAMVRANSCYGFSVSLSGLYEYLYNLSILLLHNEPYVRSGVH